MPQYYYAPPGFNNSQNSYDGYDQRAKAQYELMLRAKSEKRELRRFGCYLGGATIAYIIVQLLVSVVLRSCGLYELYLNNTIFQYAFTIVGVSFCAVAVPFGIVALLNRKKYTHPIIPNKRISASRAIPWIFFGLGCCMAANIFVNYVIELVKVLFHRQLTQGEIARPQSLVECLFELIAIAVIPAICEELAMRCFSLQLIRKYGAAFAIVTVSIVFGLLHGNVIQFLFAFIVGLVLAYVTVKTQSIVPAIFIHLCNNSLSVVQDITKLFVKDEKTANYVISAVFIFIFVAGIVSAICLFFKKEFKGGVDKGNTVLPLSEKIKAFYFPGMILPFAVLIMLTLTTIEKM